MATDRVLSQDEIDSVFRERRDGGEAEATVRAQPYDFRRPDRIAKEQLRGIYAIHENFARTLASSLSAYLRAYAVVNLVSVEQISFREFVTALPTPTYTVALGMKPFDTSAVVEVNPSLVFPILELLLGGSGKSTTRINREITEIEQCIMDDLMRIVLQNLRAAWHTIAAIDFTMSSHETDPALLQVVGPTEALIAIAMEIRIGEHSGTMNIAIPTIFVKMLRQKFDQQWSARRTASSEEEQTRVLRLLQSAKLTVEARLPQSTLTLREITNLQPGDLIQLEHPADQPIDVTLNGVLRYRARMTCVRNRLGIDITELCTQSELSSNTTALATL